MKNRLFVILAVVLCAALLCSGALANENAAAYLKEYFGVSFDGEVTAEAYNAALTAMDAEPLDGETFTLADAVIGAVRLAGMEEMAKAFVNEADPGKAAKILADEHISADEAYQPYIACALELDLVSDDADFSGPVSAETAAVMLYRAAEISGKGRHYFGRLSDDSILVNARSAMDSDFNFDDVKLDGAGLNILVKEATTGYSLKYSRFDARFIEENTLRYGHDDITHLVQLIQLLKSEDFDAYVQVEPKVSVYEYMPEWGLPKSDTPTYAVKELVDGRYFAFAMEYELVLEFDTAEEKNKFHDLVEAYAKKYDDRVDADGNIIKELLYNSFWQPLYYSVTEMDGDVYEEMIDNVVMGADGYFSIHSFSLADKTDAVAEAVREIAPELNTDQRTVYVNPAFYRYITGIDYQ